MSGKRRQNKMEITSITNNLVKETAKLSQKKYRNETKMFFELVAYNPKMTFAIFKINYEK